MSKEIREMIDKVNNFKQFVNENSEFKEKEKYKQEYIDYHGNDSGFNEIWSNLISNDFNKGGLVNIPKYVELSRLVNVVGDFKTNNNIHWVRTEDEDLFYDKDWLFLSDVKIDENTKIIRIITDKSNIDIEKTIIQNLTFGYENEVSLKNIDLIDYEIVNY
jgi:hypothetical protein